MVSLTRLDGTHFVLNTDLIEFMEATPDTVITLTNGHHFVVREHVDEVVRQVVLFRHRIQVGYGGHL
jgi:flagellar protein FlbD